MIKYKASRGTIVRVEIDRETPGDVWVNGIRLNASTDSYSYLDSLEEAKAWVISDETQKIRDSESKLMILRREIAQAENNIAKAHLVREVARLDGSVVLTCSGDA